MMERKERTLEERMRSAVFDRARRSPETQSAGSAMRAVSENVAKEIGKIFEDAANSELQGVLRSGKEVP